MVLTQGGQCNFINICSMPSLFRNKLSAIAKLKSRYDANSQAKKLMLLEEMAKLRLPPPSSNRDLSLLKYFNSLLFMSAFPDNQRILSKTRQELARLTQFLEKLPAAKKKAFINSGMPFTDFWSSFSYDFTRWLTDHPDCQLTTTDLNTDSNDLNGLLYVLLPPVLRSATTAGYSTDELFETLLVDKSNRFSFLLNEFQKLDNQPYVRDLIYDSLNLYTQIVPTTRRFSRCHNRIHTTTVFHPHGLMKSFDHQALFNSKIGEPVALTSQRKNEIVFVVKNTMALTDRETDTVTYMDEKSLRYYELEHGLSVALYGMMAERQLPLESYIGYTLFKNGLPAAYGGGWVFGSRSDFGISIFDSFRGGESGYMFCQLIRLYRQVFGITYFEVESFQYGADNEDAINSGAFWFYYRYGFRPADAKLRALARKEWKKILAKDSYRTSSAKLRKLATGNMAIHFESSVPVNVYDITGKIRQMISKEFKSQTVMAEENCIKKLLQKTGTSNDFSQKERRVLAETAMWAHALKIRNKKKLMLLVQMARTKPENVFNYQQLLKKFFAG